MTRNVCLVEVEMDPINSYDIDSVEEGRVVGRFVGPKSDNRLRELKSGFKRRRRVEQTSTNVGDSGLHEVDVMVVQSQENIREQNEVTFISELAETRAWSR